MTQPYKLCPQCQQPAVLTQTVCKRCGHQFRTQFVPANPTQAIYPQQPPAPQPLPQQDPAPWYVGIYEPTDTQRALKAITWVLYVLAWILCSSGQIPIGTLLDVVSIVIAVWLVCQRNRYARSAGWWRLGFECATWVLAFLWIVYV